MHRAGTQVSLLREDSSCRSAVVLASITIVSVFVLATGCGQSGGAKTLDLVYPLDGSIFPPEFTAPTFLWNDTAPKADRWAIEVAADKDGEFLRFLCEGAPPSSGEIDKRCISDTNELFVQPVKHSWKPDAESWERIKKRCGQAGATVTITGFRKDKPERILSRRKIIISVSKDPVGAPIFYRDVPLMPSENAQGVIQPLDKGALPLISWRLRDLSRPESRVVMKDMPSCANCHSFSSDGKTLGMDIDGPQGDKGTYALSQINRHMIIETNELVTWKSFPGKRKGQKTIGFMSQVSPDGQHVVSTVNESVYVVNFPNYKFLQVFYPTRGILVYYSRQTGEMTALPGADDEEYVHCNPVWSPDGKYIVFARAKATDPNPEGSVEAGFPNDPNELQIQYDLYRIPFNDGKGGTPEPINGASRNGKSNTFPRISPDDRWIVFVKCDNGQLMRPDSRLWIVPTAGGKAREMNCNTSLMNSWHSFSPNGRWMVFSSKSRTPYTQMFLTYINEAGIDSPPILIPNSTAANRAVNLPEFANIAYGDLINIDVPPVDWRRPFNSAEALIAIGDYPQAVVLFRESLSIDPLQARTHSSLGLALCQMGRGVEGINHLRKAAEIDPDNVLVYNKLGVVLGDQKKYDEAIECFQKAIALDSKQLLAYFNLGIVMGVQGKPAQAVKYLTRAIELDPEHAPSLYNMGIAFEQLGKQEQAIECLSKSVEIEPEDAGVQNKLGHLLGQQGRLDQAIVHFKKAIEINPVYALAYSNMALALRRMGKIDQANEYLAKAVELDPSLERMSRQ